MPLPPAAAEILDRLELHGIRLGLDSTRKLLAALGHPERACPAVLVAGTNGKGSTSALLASILQASGYRTGLYTSPHLEEVEERLRIDGTAIDGAGLGELLREVVATSEAVAGGPPTYFEALTAAAFLFFARQRVDLAVLEVGMGGRLDATNVAEPLLSVITPIGRDHTAFLGSTLTAIAREKAGILRPGRPAVAWPGGEEAEEALRTAAAEVGALLRLVPELAQISERSAVEPGRQRVVVETANHRYPLATALVGNHQAVNLALAVVAAEALLEQGWERITPASIRDGVARCRWPGRLERIELPGGGAVLLDAAHNPAGAEALASYLAETGEDLDLLFGTFADKDAEGMLPVLAATARRVVLTRPPGPRGRDPQELLRLLPTGVPALVEPDAVLALERGLEGSGLLVATGSLYLVGELRRRLRKRFGVPRAAVEPLFLP